jgi:hypothetical protein
MLDVCKKRDDCPELPQSLVIYHVKASKRGRVYTPKKIISAWRYENAGIMSIPTTAKAVQSVISGELYREGCAYFGFSRLRRKAFVSVYFGTNISMGFEYDTIVSKGTFALTNETVIWE